jgi:hypothetical protein
VITSLRIMRPKVISVSLNGRFVERCDTGLNSDPVRQGLSWSRELMLHMEMCDASDYR